ncbi:MAG: rhomboid family intramembrane serine protease [Euzebya sp.]
MDSRYPPPQPPEWAEGAAAHAPATVCYRHGDRPTRLSCSSCGRPICVDCTHQASVGQKCPECAAPSGRNRVITASHLRRSGLDGAPVNKAILFVTVAIGVLSFIAPAAWVVLRNALIDDVGSVAAGQVYRMVTAALLHSPGSLFHLGFNMWALYVFGPDLERRFGAVPFLLFYLAGAAAGGLAYQVSGSQIPALGASGAIFGLFGAYVISAYLSRHTSAGRAGLNQLLPLLVLNLALPLFIRGIAWQAHVGGLLAGVLMMVLWRRVGEGGATTMAAGTANPRMVRSVIAGAVLIASILVALVL